MSRQAKYDYIKVMRRRYQKITTKAYKGQLITELCQVLGYNRSYAIRLLNKKEKGEKKKVGRKKLYGEDLMPHIRYLWAQLEYIGAKRLKEGFKLWLKHYSGIPSGVSCTEKQKRELRKMSASTVERYLSKIRMSSNSNKGISATKPNYALKKKIPIEILNYTVSKPGTIQADTVVHCGSSMHGSYASTLTMTDIYSGWTENRAIWTKDAKQVRDQIKNTESVLPFKIHTFGTDCGSEFLNFHVMNYLKERREPIHMTRSRPYHKDDNAFVEQKNYTHVRQLFAYDRIEKKELVQLMNDIYIHYWNPLHNVFFPSIKLIKKERIGGRVKKTYDVAKTPYHRLLSCKAITSNEKKKLRNRYKKLNPFELKAELEKKLKNFFQELRRSKSRDKAA